MTLMALIVFLGFFCFYNTSKKAQLFQSTKLERWLQDNPQSAKYSGTVLLIWGLIVAIFTSGTGSGIFTYAVFIMAAGSLVVMLSPLRFVSYKVIAGVFVFSLILELI
ncbi:hypothetical protein GCM10028791_21430 [Echinicola sediminis]